MRKFKFYVNDIESEIFEYNIDDYEDEEMLLWDMENDRMNWVLLQIETGYIEII